MVEAIFPEADVHSKWTEYTQVNADKSMERKEAGGSITESQDPKEGSECVGQEA